MKSASETFFGSPQIKVPAGGGTGADATGFFKGEGCRFNGDICPTVGWLKSTLFGDSGTGTFKARLGLGA
jgi:hypothetical protein